MLGVEMIGSGAEAVVPAGLELGKGAIIGALVVGAAFLAGVAVLRRSAAAMCGLLLLCAAGFLQAIWLGLIPGISDQMTLLVGGIFTATALVFLSSVLGLAGRSQLVGGLLFAGALSLAGAGVINLALGGEAAGLLRIGFFAAAATVLALAGFAAMRGDLAARFILPGAVLVASAPLLLGAGGGGGILALAPQAIFAIGILTACLVSLVDFSAPANGVAFAPGAVAQFGGGDRHEPRTAFEHEKSLRVSENQLAQVLDYSGIAVLDWSRTGAHQTASFAQTLGADSDGQFTPEALREFIHAEDAVRFSERVLAPGEGDGGFDEPIKLHNGKLVRMRGARAVDHAGGLERIVLFVDSISAPASGSKNEALKMAAASLTAAAASAAAPANDAGKLENARRDSGKPDFGKQESGKAESGKPESGKFSDAKHERLKAAADDQSAKIFAAAAPAPERRAVKRMMSVGEAIDAGRIVAAFQPIVSFETGKASGAEALVRFPDSEELHGKALATEVIVREAQRLGKGAALTTIMLNATADHVAEQIAAGAQDYFGAFNVSLSQLTDAGFVDNVKQAIAKRGLPKGALVLELTEGEQLRETPKIKDIFRSLRAAGVSLAYDDFGAGFSSLSNLHKHEFDYLKIDKSFIDDIVANGGKKKIVSALAKLGKDFGMTVIAEGVETAEAADVAKAIGCRMGQGYHLGEPSMPKVEAAPAHDLQPVAEADVLVLDKALEAGNAPAEKVRRRLFGGRLR